MSPVAGLTGVVARSRGSRARVVTMDP